MLTVRFATGVAEMDPGDVVKHGGVEDAPLNVHFKESNKERYDSKLFESLKKKWSK